MTRTIRSTLRDRREKFAGENSRSENKTGHAANRWIDQAAFLAKEVPEMLNEQRTATRAGEPAFVRAPLV